MSASPEPSAAPATSDPLRHAAPAVDDVEARRARAAVESRLFSGPPQPVRVGRYRVEGRIGAGGMGVVYRAHDPELARDVAVKLMNADTAGSKDPSTARARLVREARAMARLAHPNVIHVYDVGTTDDGVFIAMELVEGHSLARWLEDETPAWREILRAYVAAGRGLAAAHAAGVIHRDFKPENVLRGDDGRVRVGDFGLAGGPAAERASTDSELDRDTGDLHGPSGSLTRTGTLLGTPKYMAPEQESGAVAGPSGDQFSFCVALYEALYGYPPFGGKAVAEYRQNVHDGLVLDPPPDSRVRGWVHAEIVRGLSVDPAERHPGLTPLLDRLEEALVDPNIARRRRRRNRGIALAFGLGALVITGGLGLASFRDDPAQPVTVVRAEVSPTPAPGERERSPGESQTATGAPEHPAIEREAASDAAGLPSADPDAVPADTMATAPEATAPEATGPARVPGPADSSPPPHRPAPDDPDDPRSKPVVSAFGGAPESSAAPTTRPASDENRPRAGKRKRKTDTCYFLDNKFKFLQRQRRHSRFLTGKDGRCYDCQDPAPDYRLPQLNPSDCTRYHLCVRTEQEQCSG